ncbi:HEAT repeat domain-containing protein [Cellulophaga baltica]|uniref:HEAT repeat-containing protein n=1 Tax=Cellulophaga baltica TaxID=76594 RepID=A0A1G7FI52_9FLAO|nr:hypothetical protein [Cellulophaga baltica]SDE75568.1 hypothetical protein SAMN04487992_103280 [Cellulophaga baltica]
MSNKQEQLENRGYLETGIDSQYLNSSFEQKITLLRSKIATERTLGARLLKEDKGAKTTELLINALKNEKKLYPKIEICNTLSTFSPLVIPLLIECLGKIGTNQHKKIPEKEFSKDSYPLPRDIASRTLIRIGDKAIPELLTALETTDMIALSELIDTIGHINFNFKTKNIYKPLQSCYYRNTADEVITWKIIRAFSGIQESEAFLKKLYSEVKKDGLKREIKRSLRLIELNKK